MKLLERKRLARVLATQILAKFNYKLTKDRSSEIYPRTFLESYKKIQPYTMVDPSDAFATWTAVNYVVDRKISGSLVECGVWRGGVSILMAERLQQLKEPASRTQFLFDTFEGMSEPTSADIDKHGASAKDRLDSVGRSDGASNVWAYASMEDVSQNFTTCEISPSCVKMIKGKVEDTLPANSPEKIAILRLDTDWYESTRHELIHLYPLLETGGVLLIDDYGYWSGCRKAVDEYFSTGVPRPLFTFQPSGSVVAIKT